MTPTTFDPSALTALRESALARVAQRVGMGTRFRRYLDNPVGFVRDVLHETPWSGQERILEAVRDHPRVAVRTSHGIGKSFIAARAAGWWLSAHEPGEAFVVTSAPSAPQVRAILWREIARAHARGKLPGRVNQTEWHMGADGAHYDAMHRPAGEELVAFGRKPADPGMGGDDTTVTAFQGIHALYVLVILDEADGIPEVLYTAAVSLATTDGSRILAIGNPDHASSHFAKVNQPDSGWHVIHISAFDTPNFTGEVVPPEVAAQLVSPRWVSDAERDWGRESPLYTSKVLGEFPMDDADGVVPWSWIVACTQERDAWLGEASKVVLGVDVGGGSDRTVVRERRGMTAGREWTALTKRSDEAVGLVRQAINETGATEANIDVIGIGWGVVGALQEQYDRGEHGCRVYGINVGESSTEPDRFPKLRDEVWWMARELAQSQGWDLSAVDAETLSELAAPRYRPDTAGRVKVEPKDDTRKRLGKSPDKADALNLAFYVPIEARMYDWNAAYHIVTCGRCGRQYVDQPTGKACSFCHYQP